MEVWRDVDGYAGYQVSNLGRVRTKYWREKWWDNWRYLKLTPNAGGYLRATIGGELWYVHDLVLRAFVGPPPEGMVARHNPDPTPANNVVTNLLWGTRSANNQDTARMGRMSNQKLTEEEARNIKFLLQKGLGGPEIRTVYPQATNGIISCIRRGSTWNW